jgi:hypothetical protein
MAANALSPALLTALLTRHAPLRRLIVGYSGGLDSHVLLHLLATNRDLWPDRTLAAIYVDHGCKRLPLAGANIALGSAMRWISRSRCCGSMRARMPGESPEAAARRARYAALAAELEPDAALLTAHHRDDQAETLLLQLLRGAGPHGLAAMPAVSRLGSRLAAAPAAGSGSRRVAGLRPRPSACSWIEDQSATPIPLRPQLSPPPDHAAAAGTLAGGRPQSGPFRAVVRRNRLTGWTPTPTPISPALPPARADAPMHIPAHCARTERNPRQRNRAAALAATSSACQFPMHRQLAAHSPRRL